MDTMRAHTDNSMTDSKNNTGWCNLYSAATEIERFGDAAYC